MDFFFKGFTLSKPVEGNFSVFAFIHFSIMLLHLHTYIKCESMGMMITAQW
jgi:hypothetical protein